MNWKSNFIFLLKFSTQKLLFFPITLPSIFGNFLKEYFTREMHYASLYFFANSNDS